MKQFGVTRQTGPIEVEIWLTEEEQEDFVDEVKASVMQELLEKATSGKELGMGEILLSDRPKLVTLFDTMLDALVRERTLIQEVAKELDIVK